MPNTWGRLGESRFPRAFHLVSSSRGAAGFRLNLEMMKPSVARATPTGSSTLAPRITSPARSFITGFLDNTRDGGDEREVVPGFVGARSRQL